MSDRAQVPESFLSNTSTQHGGNYSKTVKICSKRLWVLIFLSYGNPFKGLRKSCGWSFHGKAMVTKPPVGQAAAAPWGLVTTGLGVSTTGSLDQRVLRRLPLSDLSTGHFG